MSVRNPKLRFRTAMRWEPEVETFIRSHMTGKTLNVPCGKSLLGDVRVDNVLPDLEIGVLNPTGFRLGDMSNLREMFGMDVFDTVISDPPWHLGFYQRPRQFFALVEVCKIGGRVIFNAPWIPETKYAVLEETWIRQSAPFSNASILSVFRKTAAVP